MLPDELFSEIDRAFPNLPPMSGFAILENIASLKDACEFALDPNLLLRRATPTEAKAIRKLWELYSPRNGIVSRLNPMEADIVSGEVRYLKESEWRYHIIQFGTNGNVGLHDIVEASQLTQTPMRQKIHIFSAGGGRYGVGGTVFNSEEWDILYWPKLIEIGQAEIDELLSVQIALKNFQHKEVKLRDALRRYQALDAIPSHSPLALLGYMSIIEMLVTRDEREIRESGISFQVSRKMPLIGRNAKLSLPYNLFRPNYTPDEYWKKLYAYRSATAHGDNADFIDEFQCLIDHGTSLRFIRLATVSLLREALERPDFIADVQRC